MKTKQEIRKYLDNLLESEQVNEAKLSNTIRQSLRNEVEKLVLKIFKQAGGKENDADSADMALELFKELKKYAESMIKDLS